MDWIIFILVVVWLGIVSWFDIRKNEIPHIAWVIIPLIGACFYRAWQGGWQLTLITLLVAVVSERERISQICGWQEVKRITSWVPVLFLGAYCSMPISPLVTLSIIGFWIAWELKWWGGADATAAIALILINPSPLLILSFLGVHIIVAIGLFVRSLRKKESIKMHRIPGLPLLLMATIIPQTTQLFSMLFK